MVALAIGLVLAGCDGNGGGDGGAGGGGADGGGGAGGGGAGGMAGDPCEGKACGDACTSCPEGAPCLPQACDASGACVDAVSVVCALCPDTAPPDGDPCPEVGLVCETDEGVVLVCRSRSICKAEGWETIAPGCSSEPPVDPACPAQAPAAGGDCDVMADPSLCVYGDGFCGCSNCLGGPCGGQAQWVCSEPPAPPCPAVAPKLGAPCADEGAQCEYGVCAIGGTSDGRACVGGVWTSFVIPCPE